MIGAVGAIAVRAIAVRTGTVRRVTGAPILLVPVSVRTITASIPCAATRAFAL